MNRRAICNEQWLPGYGAGVWGTEHDWHHAFGDHRTLLDLFRSGATCETSQDIAASRDVKKS